MKYFEERKIMVASRDIQGDRDTTNQLSGGLPITSIDGTPAASHADQK